MIVYLISNWINGRQYVGITRNGLTNRIWHHLKADSYLGRALRKYGIQSFEITTIDCADHWSTLCEKEVAWITKLKTMHPNGYNLTNGGEGLGIPSQATRKKLSDARIGLASPMKGKNHTLDSRKKMSDARKGKPNHHNLGRVLTKESRDKISKSLMGNTPWNKGLKKDGTKWLQ